MSRTSEGDPSHRLAMARRDEAGRLVVECSCGFESRADALADVQDAMVDHVLRGIPQPRRA